MLIDWFTVAAQALNFVILAWLMKRFLYKPILDAIDAREKRISTEMAAAAQKQIEAEQARDTFRAKSDQFEQQRAALLQKAQADAATERQTLMDAARKDADALASKRQAALASQAQALGQALQQRAQAEVFAITRRALAELADSSLEARACAVFIQRLHSLEGPEKDALATTLGAAQGAVVVRSAFALPSAQQDDIRKALADGFGVQAELSFQVEPTLVAGIELVAQGQKLAWSLNEQLNTLAHAAGDLLKAHAPAA